MGAESLRALPRLVDGIWKSGAQRLAAAREIGAGICGVIDYAARSRVGRPRLAS